MAPKAEQLNDSITLYEGDCLEVLPTLTGVDAVVTDPPYGVEFQGKNTKHTHRNSEGYASGIDDPTIGPRVVSECVRLFERVLVTAPARNAFDYPKPVEIGSVFCPSGAGLGRWGFIGTHPILYYGKCPYLAKGMGHRPNSFQSFANSDKVDHPCPKPVAWMQWLIRKATTELGQTILDPFAGSGTTGIAALMEGRKAILIEKDAKYCDVIRRRVERYECQQPGSLFRQEMALC